MCQSGSPSPIEKKDDLRLADEVLERHIARKAASKARVWRKSVHFRGMT
jgi:hypothetical protein